MSGLRRIALATAGPLLIVAAVLVVMHHFAFDGLISRQYPDVLPFWLPTYCFLGKALAAGHIPAWNPHVMGGVPFAADPQSGWLYLPAMGLFTFLPCHVAIRWFVVAQPLIAGVGMYSFLRSERLSRPATTLGGLALALPLAGSYLSLNLPFAGTLAWSAVLLACVSRLVAAKTWPGRLGWLSAGAVAWGQVAASNLTDGLVIGTGALLAYFVAKWVVEVRAGHRTGRDFLLLAGLIVIGFPLIDVASLLPRFASLPRTSIGLGYHELYARTKLLTGRGTPDLIFGTGTGPTWPIRLALSPGVYLGAATLALGFAGWRAVGRRHLVGGFAAYGAVSFVLMLERVAQSLPGWVRDSKIGSFYLHDPSRFRFGLLLAVPVVAAVGVEGWRGARSWRERALLIAPGLVVWGVLPWALGAGQPNSLLLYGGLAGAAALALTAWRPALAFAIPAVVAVELCANGLTGQAANYRPPAAELPIDSLHGPINTLAAPDVSSSAYVRPGAIVRRLQDAEARAGAWRYLSVDRWIWDPRGYHVHQPDGFWPLLGMQQSMLFDRGLEEAQGYNPEQPIRYWTFVRAEEHKLIRYNAAAFIHPPPVAMNLLQVGWLIGPTRLGPPVSGAAPVAAEGRWTLYRMPAPPSRASVFSSWRASRSAGVSLETVTAGTFDPSQILVVEGSTEAPPPPPAGVASTAATYQEVGPQQQRVVADAAPEGGMALIRGTFDPNWHATVDGHSVPILHADYLLEAVPVPGGRHVVELTYDDPTIGYGLAGSAATLGGLTVAAFLLRRRRRGVPSPTRADRPDGGLNRRRGRA